MSYDHPTYPYRTHPSPTLATDTSPPSGITPFDLVAYVHSRLQRENLPELALQLGYNNIDNSVRHLHELSTKSVLGLDEVSGNFDLHFTTIELIDALCHLDIHDEALLRRIHDKCLDLRTHYQQRRMMGLLPNCGRFRNALPSFRPGCTG